MKPLSNEVLRYIVNGVVATGVHYGVLSANLHLLGFQSAGMANLVAAVFGITASFIGNRCYVFPQSKSPLRQQLVRFGGLYGAIALLHGLTLFLWTDKLQFNYTLGFLIATVLQVALSYVGNKIFVFKQ
jgi:putative flippase GtrA